MAQVGDGVFTLADYAKTLDPDGTTARVINLMSKTNHIHKDMLWREANGRTGHRTTILTGLPSITWRMLYGGAQPSKATRMQVTDTMGIALGISKVDKDLAELNPGGISAFRLQEDKPYLESMNQEVASGLFYFNTDVTPEKFLGLSSRYPYSDSPNVINNGGSGSDCTSIWLVVWGADTVHGIFPRGSQAGIEHKDVSGGTPDLLTADDGSGQFPGFQSYYQWKPGLTVRDWRYVVRIANVESDPAAASNTFDPTTLVAAYHKIPEGGFAQGRPVIYCNANVMTQIDNWNLASANRLFTHEEDAFGDPVTKFWKIPIRRCDALLNTETAIGATP